MHNLALYLKNIKCFLLNWIHSVIIFCVISLLSLSQNVEAQYNVLLKAASLDQTPQGTPIAGAVISKDQGDVVQLTNSDGDAILTNVGGVMSIKALHPDYKQFEQTFNITKDTTLYFAMPKTTRIGPWGTDELNSTWWKYSYVTATATHDPTRWKQIIPVNVRIEGASAADSLNIIAAMNTMKNSTGWDLFKIVNASKDTTFTIYMNANTNTSVVIPDVNWIAKNGYSKIGNSDIRIITHEIVKSQDGWPTGSIPVPTNANPSYQDNPGWQPIDGSYLSLKIEQDFRRKNGKQNLFIGNMNNYVALGNVGIVTITSPANGALDLDTLQSIVGTKDPNGIWYDYKLTNDALGNNIVLAQNGVDRPRINVDLEPGKTYYIFERVRNNISIGAWSTPVQVTTMEKLITSVQDNFNKSNIVIYPNPVKDFLHVSIDSEFNKTIRIDLFNSLGIIENSLIDKSKTGSKSLVIDLSKYKPGIYFLKVSFNDSGQTILIQRLIKQ
jgi:hypothetical protein